MTDQSFTFRVDSIHRAAGTPGVEFVSIAFEPEFLATLGDVIEAARQLAFAGVAVPYIPICKSSKGDGFSVEFIDDDAEALGIEFDELRVRPTGGIEVHGSADGIASRWVRADTSIDEMELVIHAAASRARRHGRHSPSRRAA